MNGKRDDEKGRPFFECAEVDTSVSHDESGNTRKKRRKSGRWDKVPRENGFNQPAGKGREKNV